MNAAHLLPLRPLRDFIASPSDRAALALFSLFFFSFSRESANGVCVLKRGFIREVSRKGGRERRGGAEAGWEGCWEGSVGKICPWQHAGKVRSENERAVDAQDPVSVSGGRSFRQGSQVFCRAHSPIDELELNCF